MKIRKGFVSNSSSSSFIIMKNNLSQVQIDMINEYQDIAKKLCNEGTNIEYMYDYDSWWNINETSMTIEGSTIMDNFSMYQFLTDFVGVRRDNIKWDD